MKERARFPMTSVLYTKDDLEFCISDTFEGIYLTSLLDNMREKLVHGEWDDYDEVHHCCRIIHEFSQRPGLTIDYHLLRRAGEQLGMVMMSHGDIPAGIYRSSGLSISDPIGEVVLLNYFHIAPQGRGNGTFWLKELLMPMYAAKGFTAIYLKSSHHKAFPFYDRFGAVIGNYTFPSDNGVFQRTGRIYRLPLEAGHGA